MKSLKISLRFATVIVLAAGALAAQTAKESGDARLARILTYNSPERIDARVREIKNLLAEMKRADDARDEEVQRAMASGNINSLDTSYAHQAQMRERFSLEASLHSEIEMLADMKQRLDALPVCRALFLSTIDKKTSDLTVRETENIAACKEMGIYDK